jgi:hypothetical protein
MRVDDLIAAESLSDDLDPDLTFALVAFGFSAATGTLFHHPTKGWIYTIAASRPDGSSLTWIGVGNTPAKAEDDAIDALSKWILNQPIPVTP